MPQSFQEYLVHSLFLLLCFEVSLLLFETVGQIQKCFKKQKLFCFVERGVSSVTSWRSVTFPTSHAPEWLRTHLSTWQCWEK